MKGKYFGSILAILTGLYWILIQSLQANNTFFESIIPQAILAGMFSFTIYKIFISLLFSLSNHVKPIKMLLLGNEYIDGYWVGYYIGESGKIRYVFEEINQTLDEIKVTGKAYDENGEMNSRWTSDAVSVNGKTGKLIYTYTVKGKTNNDDGTGIIEFSYSIKQKFGPKYFEGIYTDLQYGTRRETYEKKITIKDISAEEIIKEAKIFYESKK